MPRFKAVHKGPKLLPIDFDKQLLPGTFERALYYLVDHELDLSDFHASCASSSGRLSFWCRRSIMVRAALSIFSALTQEVGARTAFGLAGLACRWRASRDRSAPS